MDLMMWQRRFLEYTEIEKGRSIKTVENYDRYLKRFLAHAKVKQPEEITPETVREFRLWLNRLPSSPSGRSRSERRPWPATARGCS